MEAAISEDYLRALSEAYSRFFYHFDAAPVLIVNTEHLNPVERDQDLALLAEHIVGDARTTRVLQPGAVTARRTSARAP